MKKYSKILIAILCSIMCGVIGYFLGNANRINKYYDQAYANGWAYLFSNYGSKGEGIAYINLYVHGQNRSKKFSNEYEAFSTGYTDGYFFVNNSELSDTTRIMVGFKKYYPNSKYVDNNVYAVNEIIIENYNYDNYTKDIANEILNSDYVKDEFYLKYGFYPEVSLIFEKYIAKEKMKCENLTEDDCVDGLNLIHKVFATKMQEKASKNVSSIDGPIIIK